MARVRNQTWKTILIVALVLLALGMLISGFTVPFLALLVLLLAAGGGALLYRRLGPPTR